MLAFSIIGSAWLHLKTVEIGAKPSPHVDEGVGGDEFAVSEWRIRKSSLLLFSSSQISLWLNFDRVFHLRGPGVPELSWIGLST